MLEVRDRRITVLVPVSRPLLGRRSFVCTEMMPTIIDIASSRQLIELAIDVQIVAWDSWELCYGIYNDFWQEIVEVEAANRGLPEIVRTKPGRRERLSSMYWATAPASPNRVVVISSSSSATQFLARQGYERLWSSKSVERLQPKLRPNWMRSTSSN